MVDTSNLFTNALAQFFRSAGGIADHFTVPAVLVPGGTSHFELKRKNVPVQMVSFVPQGIRMSVSTIPACHNPTGDQITKSLFHTAYQIIKC